MPTSRPSSRDRRAQLALASANFSRQKRLMAANATSRSDYDSAKQACSSAEAQASRLSAQIAAAQSQLNGDQVTLGYTKIYAPMDGTVVSITTKQGMTLNANQQAPIILRVADLSTMTVWTQVSEADVPKLQVGMPAYFTTLGEPDKRWTGTLTQIQPTPDVVNNVVLYTATFDVKNPDHQLMTQMTAQVFFVTASAQDAVDRARRGAAQGPRPARARTPAKPLQADPAQAPTPRRRPARRQPPAARRGHAAARRDSAIGSRSSAPDGTLEHRAVVVGVSNRVSAAVLSGLEAGEKCRRRHQSSEHATRHDTSSGSRRAPRRRLRRPALMNKAPGPRLAAAATRGAADLAARTCTRPS